MGRLIDRYVPLRIRAAALMPAAVLTVHQLRFELAFGGRAQGKLASEGHAYLGSLAPLAAMLVAIGIGLFLAGLARAWRGEAGEGGRAPAGFLRIWLLAALALVAVYTAQELLEGALLTGHPGGLAGVFGEGGWWAVPLALLLGAVVALALRVADVAIRWAAARARRTPRRRPAAPAQQRPAAVFLALRAPLAAAAGRAPPRRLALNL